MKIFVAELKASETETLRVATFDNASLERLADVVQSMIAHGFMDEISQVNLTEMSTSLKRSGSFRVAVIGRNSQQVYYGFSAISLMTAVGAATVVMFEDAQIPIESRNVTL